MDKEKQQKRIEKYNKEHYENIRLRVKKDKKEQIKFHAEMQGESLNAFINRAIDETIERDERK